VIVPTGVLVRLDIRIALGSWETDFDVLEVWRSTMTEAGPFEELTAAGPLPARVPASGGDRPAFLEAGPTVRLVGRDLDLLLDETQPLKITFVGVDPLTFAEAAAQIALAHQSRLRSWVNEGRLILETVWAGARASLRVVGGDAAPLLRLPTQEPLALATGRDPRIPLVRGVERYVFDDPNGDKTYTYKTRFRNSLTEVRSALSLPVVRATGVDARDVVRGFVRLADTGGRPLAAHRVLVDNTFKGNAASGFLIVGGPQSALTDDEGYVEFRLVRGLAITVAIVGTRTSTATSRCRSIPPSSRSTSWIPISARMTCSKSASRPSTTLQGEASVGEHTVKKCRCWSELGEESPPAAPWLCACSCAKCVWEKQVSVDPTMAFREKHEELTLLGVQYKWLFTDGYATKLGTAGLLDARRTHDLLLERARRLTVSMTAAEREIAGMLSPQPRPSFTIPGTKPFRPKGAP
jgi:hypothetical protein